MVAERIALYLVESKGLPEGTRVEQETPLLTSGLVDSLGMMDLVAFLEETFSITVEDEDMVPDNFETLTAISAFVKRKQAES